MVTRELSAPNFRASPADFIAAARTFDLLSSVPCPTTIRLQTPSATVALNRQGTSLPPGHKKTGAGAAHRTSFLQHSIRESRPKIDLNMKRIT